MGLSWATLRQSMLGNLALQGWAGISMKSLSDAAVEQLSSRGVHAMATAQIAGTASTWKDLAENFASDHDLQFEVEPGQQGDQVIFWKKGGPRPF